MIITTDTSDETKINLPYYLVKFFLGRKRVQKRKSKHTLYIKTHTHTHTYTHTHTHYQKTHSISKHAQYINNHAVYKIIHKFM